MAYKNNKGKLHMKKLTVSLVVLAMGVLASSVVCFAGSAQLSGELGVSFRVPAEYIYPGDPIYIYVDVYNPTQETFRDIPVFAVWDIGFELDPRYALYFPPPSHWSQWHPGDVRYYQLDIPPGKTEIELLAPMTWRFGQDPLIGTPFIFFTGMSDPLFERILGTTEWLLLYLY